MDVKKLKPGEAPSIGLEKRLAGKRLEKKKKLAWVLPRKMLSNLSLSELEELIDKIIRSS